MIDLNLYRYRIGVYNVGARGSGGSRTVDVSMTGNRIADNGFLSIIYLLFYLVIYMYFALCMWVTIICMLRECKFRSLHFLSVILHYAACLTSATTV